MDLSLRTEVPHKDLIIGQKYDLSIIVYDNKNTHGYYVWDEEILENMTFKYRKKAEVGFRKEDKLIFIDSNGKETPVYDDSRNKIYKKTTTVGDMLSDKNPNKEQRDAANDVFSKLPEDIVGKISNFGGKKKRKIKTKKRKSIKKSRIKTKKRKSIKNSKRKSKRS
jgi:hypothetical protein